MDIWWWLCAPFSLSYYSLLFLSAFAILSYCVPIALAAFYFKPQDLKKKYNAEWAVVTGGSSGLGLALAEKLAAQKLNVILVALDDQLLTDAIQKLSDKYPSQKFLGVGVNLSKRDSDDDYLVRIEQRIEEAEKKWGISIQPSLIFNNAGYLIIKSFAKTELDRLVGNVECNVLSHVRVAHFFLRKMIERKQPGCITFTSSQAAFFPAPSSAMYGSGKAFLSAFASSLAIEAKPYGIDVMCLMSGPMQTNFYDNVPKLDVLKFFFAISSTPEEVAELMLRSVGRLCWRDASLYTLSTRLVTKFVDMNLLVWAITFGQQFSSDFKNNPDLR